MPNTVQLKKNGQIVYPITDVSCVMGLNGSAVTEAILCWDGASTPVVANIPAGVVVTYNTTNYTGTLAASSSTTGKIYMVATGTANNYNRYMTFASGASYAWENIGDTTIDLTTYATQAELDQLEADFADLYQHKEAITGWTTGKVYYTNKGVGNAYDTTLHGESGGRCVIVSVVAGKKYIVNGRGGNSPRLWCFAASDNKIISAGAANLSSSNDALVLTPPANATQLIINNLSGYTEDCYEVEDGDITVLKNTMNNTVLPLLSKDVYEEVNTTYTSGYITNTGGTGASSYAEYSGFVAIQSGKRYALYTKLSSGWYVGYYSSADESTFISSQVLGNNNTDTQVMKFLTVPATAQYMRVTKDNSANSKFYEVTAVLLQEKIGNTLEYIEKEAIVKKYTIKLDGTGDYTNLVTALAALANDESNKEIYLEGGTHDILSQMGGQTYIDSIPSDVQPSAWPTYSNFVPNNTKIIGIGNATLDFQVPDGTSSAKMAVLCPLAFKKNVTVENITITAKNCRYCIHDETGGDFTSYTKVFRNVKLYKTGGGYSQAYGAGFSKNCNILFDGCLFSSNDTPVWSTHDNVSGSDFTNITIKDCIFITSQDTHTALRFATLNDLNGKKSVMIENCYLGSGKIHLDDSSTYTNKYALTIMGSGTPTISVDSGNNPYPPVIL